MPGIIDLRRQNPWAQMMPSFVANMIMQQMATKARTKAEAAAAKQRAGEKAETLKLEKSKRKSELLSQGYQIQPPGLGSLPAGGQAEGFYRDPYLGADIKRPKPKITETVIGGKKFAMINQGGKITLHPTNKRENAWIEQWKFANKQFEKGAGPDPGPFTQFRESMAKAGSTNINLPAKLEMEEAKKNIGTKVKFKDYIRRPVFKADIIKNLKSRGPIQGQEWDEIPQENREALIFTEAERTIKEGFPDKNIKFGVYKGKQGWWELDANGKPIRFVKRWEDFVPSQQRSIR